MPVRIGLLGIVLAACAPTGDRLEPARVADADNPAIAPWLPPPERDHSRPDPRVREVGTVPGSPLLVAQRSAAVSGHHAQLVVYEDGRAFVHEQGGMGSRPEQTFSRALRLDDADTRELRSLLASEGYRDSDESYAEPGVMDGGSVSYFDAISQRELRITNRPSGLPEEVAELRAVVDELHARVVGQGSDPFVESTTPGLGILAKHSLLWDDANEPRDLVVYADGMLELCGAERAYDLGHGMVPCRVGFIATSRLVPLRARLGELARSGAAPTPSKEALEGTRTRLWHGLRLAGSAGGIVLDDRSGVPPELDAVMVELAMLRRALEDG